MDFKSLEVGKLLNFAYDLHEKELDWGVSGTFNIPNFKYAYNNSKPDIKRLNKGAIFGHRSYANHSDNTVYTTVGVIMGKHSNKRFKYIKSIMFSTPNIFDSFWGGKISINNLKLDNDDVSPQTYDENNRPPNLTYDHKNDWGRMPDEEKINIFLEAMETVGFLREDVLKVLKGEKTAEEAFIAVAPENLINIRWVNIYRKHFIFDGNVAIKGSFGSIKLDSFPFPFDEPVIMDCSKVKTSCIEFGQNIKKHRLINVNSYPQSITFTDIRNVIIDEIIDLSMVDASWTKFGHHKIINLDRSIAKLEDMDLTLAIDEYGNNFQVNNKGVVQLDEYGNFKISNSTVQRNELNNSMESDFSTEINVFANADKDSEVKLALKNGADGIGLVRTEHTFFEENLVPIFIGEYAGDKKYDKALSECEKAQKRETSKILKNAKGKKVVFRLLDARLKELADLAQINDYNDEYLEKHRGAASLLEKRDFLKMQAKTILEEASNIHASIDILVPMITDYWDFYVIKGIIKEISKEVGFDNYRVGAMIENIEAANTSDFLVKQADFISFGTNDLTESVTGIPRDSFKEEYTILTDDVKSVIEESIYRARVINPNIEIGFCGDHSSQVENLEFMKDMGASYISCNSSFISTARHVLLSIESTDKHSIKSKTYK